MRRAAALLCCAGLSGCSGTQSALAPAGPQAQIIASIIWLFFGVCAVVYVLTLAALFWALVRRRRSSDDSPETSRRLATIIAGVLAVVVVTLVALTVASVITGRGLTAPAGARALTVEVVGHQWWWDFRYEPATSGAVSSPNELHIPVGVPVVIRASSRDVIHSFWVPNLHGKRDLIPGMTTETWIQADRPGVYRGQCAEFCGHQHAHMAFLVVAEPMEQFERWLRHQRTAAPPPSDPAVQRGHDLFMTGPCVLCHSVRGTPAGSRVGPDLTHLASRRTIGAGTLPMTRGHLAGWIADPQSIKPGSRMPPNLVRGDDLQALVAYLETLR